MTSISANPNTCISPFICFFFSLEKQKNRALNTLGNLTFSGTLNGQLLDTSRISGTTDDLFTNKLKAELDRSINKHLEAGMLKMFGGSLS